MANKQCLFNKLWLDSEVFPEFSGWLDLVIGDATSAYCKVCLKSFKLSNMGKQSIVSHAKGPTHVKNFKIKTSQPTISFFTKKHASAPSPLEDVHPAPSSASTSATTKDLIVPGTSQTSLKTFSVNEDDVTSAEAIWALQVVIGKMSLNSCDETSLVFKKMFPDSKIAQSFSMGKTKASYVINHGLAPYFQDVLQNYIKGCSDYVVCFDESLNKFVQRGQMDLCIRFWDVNFQKVSTRYWNSVFLGRATADHLLDGFIQGLSLPLGNILQVSMDGPNVNLSFMKKLESHLQVLNPEGKFLLDIGVCSLHTVNGAMKTAISKSDWDLFNFFRSLYSLFKDSPARRAKYTELTNSTNFPFKFTSVRWLENGRCVDQALKVYDHVEKFLKEFSEKDNKNLQILKEAMKNPLLKAKLSAFRSLLADVGPFLRRFQSQKPMIPFLFTSLEELMKNLMMRFVKSEKIIEASTFQRLINLDLQDSTNLVSIEKVDVGFAAKVLMKKAQCSEKEKLLFKNEFKNLLITMVEKLRQKSPLKSHLARGLTAFDPNLILLKPSLAIKRIDTVLEHLHTHRRICDKTAEKAKKQFSLLTEESKNSAEINKQMNDFVSERNDAMGLDELYYKILGEVKKYEDLWSVMKLCFILSHGNASVESGFSVNKHLLVENLLEESLVSQRIICDSIQHLGGLGNVNINRNMLTSVRSSRRRYQLYLEKKKDMQSQEEKKRVEKRKIEFELKELEEKRQKLKIEREKEDVEIEEKKRLLDNEKRKN